MDFLSIIRTVSVIVLILLKYPNMGAGTKMERAGKRYSLFIYIAHMIPILYIFKATNGLINNFGPVVVFATTLVAAVLMKAISLPHGNSKHLE